MNQPTHGNLNRGFVVFYAAVAGLGGFLFGLVMAKLGLFQTDGGCRVDPIYEIGSPLYERVEIDLGERYGRGQQFVIEARGASRKSRYV
jgi:putative alpha-1,2-mannosidase